MKALKFLTVSVVTVGFLTHVSAGTDYHLIAESTALLIDNVDRLEANLAAGSKEQRQEIDAVNQEILQIRKSTSELSSTVDAEVARINQEIRTLTDLVRQNTTTVSMEREKATKEKTQTLQDAESMSKIEERLMMEINSLRKELKAEKANDNIASEDTTATEEVVDKLKVDKQKAQLQAFIDRQKVDSNAE
jgi:predicted  nucleic acid-binding Zn-ribbon protein